MKLRIKELRESHNLCQIHIAEYLKCTQQTYSRYETEELQPSLPVLEKLARFYGTSIDYLLGLTEDKTQNWSRENLDSKEALEDIKCKEVIMNNKKGIPKPRNRK